MSSSASSSTSPSPPYSPFTYRERQDPLLALCRSCRTLRAVAQPVLFEVVELGTRRQMDDFLAAAAETSHGRAVRTLRIFTEISMLTNKRLLTVKANDVQSLVERCPRVSLLYLTYQNIDLAQLEPLSDLQFLHFAKGSPSASSAFVLPRLKMLSLSLGELDVAEKNAIFSIASFPSLRNLLLLDSSSSTGLGTLLPTFLSQLDSVAIEIQSFEDTETLPLASVLRHPRVLVDLSAWRVHRFRPGKIANLRVLPCPYLTGDSAERLAGAVDSFVAKLAGTNARASSTAVGVAEKYIALQSLWLPSPFHPSNDPLALHPTLPAALVDLRQTCEHEAIRVEYYSPAVVDRNLDFSFADEFLVQCQLAKEAEAALEGNGGVEEGGEGKAAGP
ncbi:hypothetical protein JCM6882_009058 [Rhodosporidiobolus microsporus]